MVPSGPRSFRAFWSRKRRKQSKHSKASTEPRCSENDGADFHSIPSAHSPASQSSRSAPSKVVQRKSAVLAAEPDVRVSALFYPNKSDQKPIPGGLAITRDVVYFQADPRFEQSNKRRFHSSLSWEIVIHTADLIEAGAVTSPNEESNGERRSMTFDTTQIQLICLFRRPKAKNREFCIIYASFFLHFIGIVHTFVHNLALIQYVQDILVYRFGICFARFFVTCSVSFFGLE
eukprot:GEMP01066366.1.p1 GENE.GEMP01066366.1~~GEMP01066366.1.p1  ORF type:complete len:232 (+),score=8.33 GEMP01066366.1:101-796(+)